MGQNRPLSPHLSIWKWRVNMAASIFHRVSGHALAFAGVLMLCWWLAAAATSPEAYETFLGFANSWLGLVMLIGLTWSLFQHLCSGIRHLVMDTGRGYSLSVLKMSATWVFAVAALLTILVWAYILLGRGA
ncbi:MAG: succinate dehydrogenase, cytochrome b556 subunit [Sphingomonadaceae bacterium]